ncbi:MAG: hypothetical protein MR673_00805, partial [Fusobacterium perfoetens]|uniref:hypothetical protein n=1 Tax=Fusobacterium perfoetens TaxID=852 RepID=UPI0023EF7549
FFYIALFLSSVSLNSFVLLIFINLFNLFLINLNFVLLISKVSTENCASSLNSQLLNVSQIRMIFPLSTGFIRNFFFNNLKLF